MAPWQRDKQEWVRGLAELEPDLVVDTGDNLGHERGIDGVRYALEPFRGIPGVFVNGSNDYFGPQIYASENPGAWTLSYGLESFKGAHHTDWNLTMAATVLVMAPVILVFFFAQKAFVEGVTLTGVKG